MSYLVMLTDAPVTQAVVTDSQAPRRGYFDRYYFDPSYFDCDGTGAMSVELVDRPVTLVVLEDVAV